MDSKALLAVLSKVRQMYSDKEGRKFLSFPYRNHYTLDPELLTMLGGKTAAETSAALQHMNEFSRIVNLPARSIVFDQDNERLLWDVYSEIVNGAVMATGPEASSENQLEYEKALMYLYTDGDSLRSTMTPIYAKYREIDDQLYNVISEMTYAAGDQAKLDELRRRKNDLENRLSIEGHEMEVKKALNIIESVTRNSPACIWERLKNNFSTGGSSRTTPDGSTFYPTYIYPSNVHLQQWEKITLDEEAINKLSEDAPEELKALLDGSNSEEKIVEVSFECRSVKLDRPWMDSDVFDSDQWRFLESDDHLPLSCGLTSQHGTFPAYVTALILARNLHIRTAKETLKKVKVTQMRLQPKTAKLKTVVQTSVDQYNDIMILAYDCKKLDVCPRPDPDADWGGKLRQGELSIIQAPGGTIEAKVNDTIVDGGFFNEWKEICLTAIPDDGHLLESWMVNSERYPSSSIHLNIKMCTGGLTIRPTWKKGEALKEKDFDISPDGKTLLKWRGKDAELDMNASSELFNVECIGKDAFAKNRYLRRLNISEKVVSIEESAFSDCHMLEKLIIPASVTHINPEWFSPMSSFTYPEIVIEPSNKVYEVVDGIVMDKGDVMTAKLASCPKCSLQYYYQYNLPNQLCPSCGNPLTIKDETMKIARPEKLLDFKTEEASVISTLRNKCSKGSFLADDFKAALPSLEFRISKVYLPSYMMNVNVNAKYTAHIIKTETVAEGTQPVEKKEKLEGTFETQIKQYSVPVTAISKGSAYIGSFSDADRFRDSILAEALAEVPAQNISKGLQTAQDLIEQNVRAMIIQKKVSGASELMINSKYSDLKLHHNLSPCWLGNYEFSGTRYKILVDGHTGRILECPYPQDKKKKLKISLIVIGAIAAAILLAILLL